MDGAKTLDIEEAQFLVRVEADEVIYYAHWVGLIRVSRGVWIVATPSGEILLRQLELEMAVVPLLRNIVLPRVSRPYYILLAYGLEIHALRTQA